MRPVLANNLALANSLALAVSLVGLTAMPALAADTAEDAAALAPIHAFIDGTNTGNTKAAAAAFAPDAAIIDELPPYVWRGPGAYAAWGADFGKAAKAARITEPVITLETPRKLELTGSRGYAVIPARYDFKEAGRPVHEHGTFTVALTKRKPGWRIAAWSWTWDSTSK